MKLVLWVYLLLLHGFRVRYDRLTPRGRPYIAVMSHTSALDVAALMVADPYSPATRMIIKQEMMGVPVLSWILRQWGAIPVERRGADVRSLREIMRVLREGGGICVAPQGTRSADGRLGPVNPVLARLIVQSRAAVFPIVVVGARECLPRGAKLPRPGRIHVETGAEIDLRRFRGRQLAEDDVAAAAKLIRDAIAELLPESMKPDPSTPILGTYVPEQASHRAHMGAAAGRRA